jgi:small subunit ribosomal protein S5
MPRIDPNTLELSEERVIKTNKVQKTHKGGRTLSWNALVVVGDGKGHVGVSIGKARGIPDAIRKGFDAARKELIRVPLAGTTIPHQVLSSAGAATVLLKPASPGTGVVAGGSVRAILEAAGVRDVLAKSLGSSNAINTAWATIKALTELKSVEQVAALRGVAVEDLPIRRARPRGAAAQNDGAWAPGGGQPLSTAPSERNGNADQA